MTVRLNLPPAQPASGAVFGYNMQATFTDTTALAAVKSGGATIARFQPAWANVESYGSPGTYSLGSSTEAALAYCGAHGIKVVAVCAYGPPYSSVLSLTVGAAGASIGAYTIPISSGNLASIQTPLDHIWITNSNIPTGKWGYYGALIDSVNVAGGTITLASQLTEALTPGQTLSVQRLLYASPADQLLTNPSLIAYFNYLKFVAGRIAANGATGWCAIWNEPPWTHDPWDARGKFYDSVPGGMNGDTRMKVFLQYALTVTTLPAGVRIMNGSSDKTGSDGMIEQSLTPTASTVAQNVNVESVHPYHNLPEGSLWDRMYSSGSQYQPYNQTIDASGNFRALAYAQDQANVGLSVMATECGDPEADDNRQAIYLLRRVAASWASKVIPLLYSFSTDGAASNYPVAGAAPSYTPRAAYTALQSLMAIVAGLAGAGGAPSSVPILVGCPDGPWPLMGCGLYGANGGVLLLWQRTGADQLSAWNAVPPPPTYSAQFYLPASYNVVSASVVRTGATVTTSRSGDLLTVNGIGEEPIAIVTS